MYYTDVCNLTRTPESWPHFSLKTVQNLSSKPNHSHFPFEIHINSVKKSLFQSQSLGDSNGFSGEKGATTCGKPPVYQAAQ
jgi:hypothetical protein